MQFQDGAFVYTTDGKHVGSIKRVVIDPRSKEVTHLVVEKGLFFTEDKVVPISLIGPATADRVTLREDAGDLEKLPDFEESYFVSTEVSAGQPEEVPEQTAVGIGSIYWYPPADSSLTPGIYGTSPHPGYVKETSQNIPDGSVALKEGSRVISSDGEHVGDVERVFTDASLDKVTHILVSQGLILKEKKLVPVTWISSIGEEEVDLLVTSHFVENLPEYEVQP
jgi:uncharacterized protein YrrD